MLIMDHRSRSLRGLKIVINNSQSEVTIQQVNNQNGSQSSSNSKAEPEMPQFFNHEYTEMIGSIYFFIF